MMLRSESIPEFYFDAPEVSPYFPHSIIVKSYQFARRLHCAGRWGTRWLR